ncbi:MAG TPA: glycoside hydrolase family 2 TIM barrel-domain containing protein [Segetibacter sp.]
MKKKLLRLGAFLGLFLMSAISFAQKTEVQFLSGLDKDNTVQWDFMCTAGHNSGTWTKIAVPSNWEFQGFGNYTYGGEKEDKNEAGLYKYNFNVAKSWANKEVFIVFDGSMTDTEVKINGELVGPVHQGAFYRFKYNISPFLKKEGSNLLEVKVSKVSANQLVNEAERGADFWVFGGIFRPVFLEAYPKEHLERFAIDAKADGSIAINAFPANLQGTGTIVAQVKTKDGKPFGSPIVATIKAGDSLVKLSGKVINPKAWSTEFPNLYSIDVTLKKGASIIHTLTETIGFRTIEFRKNDGIYVNGKRMMFKGVNRGSFWPTSGRTTSKAASRLDANLIKDMNMNAVRMSHYPPDNHFLDICDSIGLLVIDELTSWQYPPYDTETGRKLVKELILKDINHPSIVLWANGNEGGFNFDLVPEYPKHDIQKRFVIHPWLNRDGVNTKHYIPWNYGINTFFQGKEVFFPTEFLHGLYDGGHGAGLDDFWNLMLSNPLSAGGFLWDFCDQGAVRTDQNGRLDTKGNAAADGILGPYREKEGSFYTIKEIWSPVYFQKKILTNKEFDGRFQIENRYDFTNLNRCAFKWKLKKFTGLGVGDTSSVTGSSPAPDIAPKTSGALLVALPKDWKEYDALYITGTDMYGREIYTWSWPLATAEEMAKRMQPKVGTTSVVAREDSGSLIMTANGVEVTVDLKTGLLLTTKNSKGSLSLKNGPVLLIPGSGTSTGNNQGTGSSGTGTGNPSASTATPTTVTPIAPPTITHADVGGNHVVKVAYGQDNQRYQFTWTMMSSGILQLRYQYQPPNTRGGVRTNHEMLGVTFDYPEENVKGIQLLANGPYHVYKNRMKGTTFNSWNKPYNNSVTGEVWQYPEFKGYYSNFYGGKLQTKEVDFSIYTETENLFLHLFNPAVPKSLNNANSMAVYPKSAGISFMHGITSIGTKSQRREDLGPQSQDNIVFANGGNDTMSGTLYFDFR